MIRRRYCCSSVMTLMQVILSYFSVNGGIIPYDLILLPRSTSVQFDNGIIRAPGAIDLQELTFTTKSKRYIPSASAASSSIRTTNDFDTEEANNKSNNNGDGDELDELRLEAQAFALASKRFDEADEVAEKYNSTIIDIAVFPLPASCSSGVCDWADLGIGKRRFDNNKLLWCCSQEALELGYCVQKHYGRLIIDNNRFRGNQYTVDVPKVGNQTIRIPPAQAETEVYNSGTYVILYANCNELGGTEVHVNGNVAWKSNHGYLPGELFPFMIIYVVLSLIYFALFMAFAYMMHVYVESRIEIEKWILISIMMGLAEMMFRSGDYLSWNIVGYRSTLLVWVGILVGALKQGVSRCLLIMVSMGWGVTRDTLGNTMQSIVVFGGTYIGTEAVIDSMVVFTVSHSDKLSDTFHDRVVGIVALLTNVKGLMDLFFVLWVLESLRKTISYLIKMDQATKLSRTRHLRNIFAGSILINIILYVTLLILEANHDIEGGLLQKRHAWISATWTEVNYLFVLIGIAILWRPNENAQQYVYTMELPTLSELHTLVSRSRFTKEDSVKGND